MIAFGRFRMLDLGDLTWNKEQELVCPNNLLGTVDVYLTTHHGAATVGTRRVIVHALKPRVAIMNNGPKKGRVGRGDADRPQLAGARGLLAAALLGGCRQAREHAGADDREPGRVDRALSSSSPRSATAASTVTNSRTKRRRLQGAQHRLPGRQQPGCRRGMLMSHAAAVAIVAVLLAAGGQWPEFRGPDGTGIVDQAPTCRSSGARRRTCAGRCRCTAAPGRRRSCSASRSG